MLKEEELEEIHFFADFKNSVDPNKPFLEKDLLVKNILHENSVLKIIKSSIYDLIKSEYIKKPSPKEVLKSMSPIFGEGFEFFCKNFFLYKYCKVPNEEGVLENWLKNKTVRLSTAYTMNDPFELVKLHEELNDKDLDEATK
jgi:hypothetical protein